MKLREIKYGDKWPINLHWSEDPVRPQLNREFRHLHGREVYTNDGAIICVAMCSDVPSSVADLDTMVGLDHAVFYTVWSRQPGSGRTLVTDLWKHMLMTRPYIDRYVTLSPKTRMAWKFHISNGALLLRHNEDSDNYEYSEQELIRDEPGWIKEKDSARKMEE